MYGVINCDASLSCAGNGAFESTEGPADATKETVLAFLHQGAKSSLIFNGNRVQAKVPTDVLHCKQETRCRGKVRRAVDCLLCNSRQSMRAEIAIGQVSWVRNSEGSLRDICILN